MPQACIGVLIPGNESQPPPPEARPLSRAALDMVRDDVVIVFGDRVRWGRISGLMPVPGGWVAVEDLPVHAVYDRWPSVGREQAWNEARRELSGVALANPASFALLCRDKVAFQRLMEREDVPMPPIERDPARFPEAIAQWGGAFLKPRSGSLGAGTSLVTTGSPLPSMVRVSGDLQRTLLQRAVPPPSGFAGVCVRQLCQRAPDPLSAGSFVLAPAVVRRSTTDPVVNVARDAEVAAAEDVLDRSSRDALEALTWRTLAALGTLRDAALIVEVGLDFVIDRDGQPHLIEGNHKPACHLHALATRDPARFGSAHEQSVRRPLEVLLARVERGVRLLSDPLGEEPRG